MATALVALALVTAASVGFVLRRARQRRIAAAAQQRLLLALAMALAERQASELPQAGNPGQTGARPKCRVRYRTRDGQALYEFSTEQVANDCWRIYIESQPDYGDRPTDAHSTHRLSEGDRKYVCWSGPVQNLDQALAIAALWAENTQQYIRNGQRF